MAGTPKGLIFAFLLNGQGGAKSLTWEEMDAWKPEDGQLWAHFEYNHSSVKNWLLQKAGLDRVTVSALTSDETRPRSVISDQGLLLFARAVNLNPGQEPEDMVSLRLFLDKNRLITTRRRRLLSIHDVRLELENKQGAKNLVDLVLRISDHIMDRIADVLDDLDEQIDKLEQQVVEVESRLLRAPLSEIRREAIMLRRYIAPQREAFYRLYIEETPWFDNSARLHFREVTDRTIRYIEDLDSLRDRAAIVQEELMSRISEQMDKRMLVLSMAAVIFLPLTFVTGLLGMNVAGIPAATNKYAFAVVCIVLIGLSFLQLWIFKKKKWI